PSVSDGAVTRLSAPMALPTATDDTDTGAGRVVAGAIVVGGGGGGGGSLFAHAPATSNRGIRLVASLFIGVLLSSGWDEAQLFAGIFSFCPGKILLGSLRMSVLASKILFHSLPLP